MASKDAYVNVFLFIQELTKARWISPENMAFSTII